jgi:hypothetical protein
MLPQVHQNYLYQSKVYCTQFVRHKRFLLIVLLGVYMHSKLSGPNNTDFPYKDKCTFTCILGEYKSAFIIRGS